MHPRAIWAIARKDALDIWLNKSTLAGLFYPIIMSLVFLLISRLVGSSTDQLLIYDPGHSKLAAVVQQAFPGSETIQANSAAEVAAAFGPDGAEKESPYALGLVLPEDFDQQLTAGNQPTVTLYINGTSVSDRTAQLFESAIVSYGRTIANPRPPVTITTTTINPPSTADAGVILGQLYTPMALLLSLIVGTSFIPLLLLEEKEKKTIKLLLSSPVSFGDILVGKLLVVLFFQLLITIVALGIQGGLTGNLPLVLLFILIGACFSLSLGLLLGSLFNTSSAAGAANGFLTVVIVIGGLFVGPLGDMVNNSLITDLAKALPTYYLAEGVLNAVQMKGTFSSNLLDIAILLGSTVILIVISSRALRRQTAELALI